MNGIQAVAKFVYPRCDFVEVDDFFLAVSLDDEHDFSVNLRLLCTASALMGRRKDAEVAICSVASSITDCCQGLSFWDGMRMNPILWSGCFHSNNNFFSKIKYFFEFWKKAGNFSKKFEKFEKFEKFQGSLCFTEVISSFCMICVLTSWPHYS